MDIENVEELDNPNQVGEQADEVKADGGETISLSGLYQSWFLDYASYVILERAVPDMRDGLKPVQRRILHSMKELDDGRYNKVANVIGNTMKYHPHGDASIGDALVQLGQKDLLIDCQGNWGNIFTGDPAAAPRYIEARLSKFALDVVFNPKTTNWLLSYDGRNKEPETLPVKFPLLLNQGVEGIAVGLASKILPHNFLELIDASIKHLRHEPFELFPDFPTGGMIDVSRYNDGVRGGKVRVRAKIGMVDKKTLVITELPFSTNTSSLIDSILTANDKGKIKIKKIEDNTAENVEIMISLGPGVSPDQTIDALYAFTNCEISISPNACTILNDKPSFIGASDLLKYSTNNTLELLRLELQIKRAELLESWHFSNLEKIFIRERIYRDIEEAETWEMALELIDKGLTPYKHLFKREITTDDIVKLTEIKIKRISKYNEFKADEIIKGLEDQIDEVDFHLNHIVDYTIAHFQRIKDKYGKGKERKTEIRNFETIDAASVAVSNVKLYVDRENGFVGTGLKKDEFVADCSDIDDIISFREDGTFKVTKIDDKIFIGQNIIHVAVFNKNDDRTIYNVIYRDGKNGKNMAKRFNITSIIKDKIYDITKGTEGSKVLYFSANPNGEAEVVNIKLRPRPNLKKLSFDFDFSELAIKGRNAQGNTVTKNIISKVLLKEDGVSTLGARQIWYDDTVNRLNADGRGKLLGQFHGEDKILTINKSGHYKMTGFDLATHFDDDMIHISKFHPDTEWTLVYIDGETMTHYLKRFTLELTDKKTSFLGDHPKSEFVMISCAEEPKVELIFDPETGPKNRENEIVDSAEFIKVKSFKAKGKRLSNYGVKEVNFIIEEDENQSFEANDADGGDLDENPDEIQDINNQQLSEEEMAELKRIAGLKITMAPDDEVIENEVIESGEVDAKLETKDLNIKPMRGNISGEGEAIVKPLLDVEPDETVIEKPKTAKAKPAKKAAVKKESDVIKVKLDSEDSLQMELEF